MQYTCHRCQQGSEGLGDDGWHIFVLHLHPFLRSHSMFFLYENDPNVNFRVHSSW